MKKQAIKCAVCGKKFVPASSNQVYCSKKCKAVAAKKRKAKAKPTTKKPVKLADKVKLPAKPTTKVVVKKVAKPVAKKIEPTGIVHTIKPGDTIRFDKSFDAERVLCYALRLSMLAIRELGKK